MAWRVTACIAFAWLKGTSAVLAPSEVARPQRTEQVVHHVFHHVELEPRRPVPAQLLQMNTATGWKKMCVWLACFIPEHPAPRPYTARTDRAEPSQCRGTMDCSIEREGIGRRSGVTGWALCFATPMCLASLIMFVMSKKERTYGKLSMKTSKAFTAMILTAFITFGIGRCCFAVSEQTLFELCRLPLLILFLVCGLVFSFWNIDIEFAPPEFESTAFLQSVSALRAISGIVLWLFFEFFFSPSRDYPMAKKIYLTVKLMIPMLIVSTIPRNIGFLVWLCYITKRVATVFYYWEDTTGLALLACHCAEFARMQLVFLFTLLCLATPYLRDRYFLAAFSCLLLIPLRMGQDKTITGPVVIFAKHMDHVAEVLVLAILCCLSMRYQIVLPRQLQKVKYVRLGYLYEQQRAGQMIRRSQELPESAFGNPAKVVHLVIISHHWLDGHTCDMATDEYPQGVRLTTLCQRLEQFFPSTLLTFTTHFCSHPLTTLGKVFMGATYSAYDVLIFFDYMSLPQIGTLPDGALIQRTEEEQAIFKETLPACGLLYTMFPVMVCPEVCEGVTPYSTSGWCFCEWEQAKLCGTLSPYSELPDDGEEAGNATMESIEEELHNKLFRCEEDRSVVRDIVKGTWIRRALLAAVVSQDVTKVRSLLQDLTDNNLQHTVSFPVDSSTLDTLLHVAKKLPSFQIEGILLYYGADPTHANHRGEQPGEFLIFPRTWLTARESKLFFE